jgi:putative ABC transport system permease protein
VDWRTQSKAFTDIGAVQGRSLTLANVDEPERLEGSAVSWNLFPMLGVSPALGRQIRAEEDKPGADRVVLLSDGLWQRRFGRDPSIVGKTLMLNEQAYTVIGVMGPAFKFPENSELWIPLRENEGRLSRDAKNLFTFGRLAPGVTIERARTAAHAGRGSAGQGISGERHVDLEDPATSQCVHSGLRSSSSR